MSANREGDSAPGKLWSLWGIMDTFDASGLLSVIKVMGLWSSGGATGSISENSRDMNVAAFESYYDLFNTIGLPASKATLERTVIALRNRDTTWENISPLGAEFCGRIIDETGSKSFFSLNMRETEYFTESRRGWETAIARFPEIIDDVEESSKCFALSRYPASVFHSVQVVESGLIELGRFLKVTDPHSGWTSVSNSLDRVIKKSYSDRTRFERKNFSFLEQVQGTVQGLKNAWRNKISHAQGRMLVISKEFSPEIAEEIMMASRAFMRRLAECLPPTKTKKQAL